MAPPHTKRSVSIQTGLRACDVSSTVSLVRGVAIAVSVGRLVGKRVSNRPARRCCSSRSRSPWRGAEMAATLPTMQCISASSRSKALAAPTKALAEKRGIMECSEGAKLCTTAAHTHARTHAHMWAGNSGPRLVSGLRQSERAVQPHPGPCTQAARRSRTLTPAQKQVSLDTISRPPHGLQIPYAKRYAKR